MYFCWAVQAKCVVEEEIEGWCVREELVKILNAVQEPLVMCKS